MAMNGLLRVGEVCLRVLDLPESRRHYGDRMGLIESHIGDDDKAYYKGADEHDWYSLVIRQADESGIDYIGFKTLAEEDLERFEGALEARGIATRWVEAGAYPLSGRRLIFTLPTGHEAHIYAHKDQNGNGMPLRNPGTIPDEGYIRGMRIIRMDHVLIGGPNIEEARDLMRDVFGWTVSEQLVDHTNEMPLAVFLSASTKPHDIAFILQPEPARFHHVSFLLESVNDLYHAADLVGKYDIAVDVAPNRHGVTRGATIYFFDPSGNRNEVFTGGYVHYPDTPTLTWDTSQLGRATFSHDNTPRESFLNVLT